MMRYFSEGWSAGFDGPGRRWVVYLHGCNFKCPWCASPESFLAPGENGTAPEVREMTPAQFVESARLRAPLFTSGGGVTFGGGEPTLQAEEVCETIDLLREIGIHTAVESNAGTPGFKTVAEKADLMICDLKSTNADALSKYAGGDLDLVKDNLEYAARKARSVWIRIPFVRGINDSLEERRRIADCVASLHAIREDLRVDVLRMHHLGAPKYEKLGREYLMKNIEPPSREEAEGFAEMLRECGAEAAAFA